MMLTAVLHLLGASAVLFVVIFVSGVVDGHISQNRLERILNAASVKLDLPRSGVFAGEFNAEISHYLAERYDADRLVNRISDIGRPVFLILEWFSYCAQMAIVVVAGWFAFTSDPAYAVAAWSAVPVALVLWVLLVCASTLLYVLTGRVPGEAMDARALSVRLHDEDGFAPGSASKEPGKVGVSPSR